jgi:ech hydrogenase subunit A
MEIILFLIAFSLAISLVFTVLPVQSAALRKAAGLIANPVIAGASVFLYFQIPESAVFYSADFAHSGIFILSVELLLAAIVTVMSLKARKYFIAGLALAQSSVMIIFEAMYGKSVSAVHNMFADRFSVIMALIIGIIGSFICNYAAGYMAEYHEHYPEVKNRSRLFFFTFYLFLSAMFGLVFANSMVWLHFFWEITTFCSFILIGYRGDLESTENAFSALWMNLLGGLAFPPPYSIRTACPG